MAKRPRHSIYAAYVVAFLSAWAPRLPFVHSKRFWIWTLSVFSTSLVSLFVGLKVLGVRTVEIPKLIAGAICITVPCQTIGMIVHSWIDQRRGERRGFRVLPADDEGA